MNRPTYVTQGLKDTAGRADWPTVALQRLMAQYSVITPGDATLAAEGRLGLDRCTYWFVERSDADYCWLVLLTALEENEKIPDALVSPFDTGGLAAGLMRIRGDDPEARLPLLSKYSWDFGTAIDLFFKWRSEAFSSPADYYWGVKPPNQYYVEEYEPPSAEECDPRDWTWELRVPINTSMPKPTRVVLTEEALTKLAEEAAKSPDYAALLHQLGQACRKVDAPEKIRGATLVEMNKR